MLSRRSFNDKMLVILAVIFSSCVFTGDARMIEDINMFDVVDLSKLNETAGYHSGSKAYEFTNSKIDLVAFKNVSTQFAKDAFLVKQFTVKAYLLPAPGSNGGTIVFFSRGKQRGAAFNVVYDWKSDAELRVESVFYIRGNSFSVSCEFAPNAIDVKKDEWLHLEVRVHIDERLIRCQIKQGDKVKFRYSGRNNENYPVDAFPADGRLRLAQQLLSASEHLLDIQEPFVGKLQDVIISFGDPNCTITIQDNFVVRTTPGSSSLTSTACPKTPVKDDTCLDGEKKKRNNGEKWKEGRWVECSCDRGKTYCIKSGKRCIDGGQEYREGDTWESRPACQKCKCKDGLVECVNSEKTWQESGCNWTCKSATKCPHDREPGCYCPNKMVQHNGKCVDRLTCPCVIKNKSYRPGPYRIGCDYCTCKGRGVYTCYKNVLCG